MSNSTQYKLFIGDDKKYMLFGMTFSLKKFLEKGSSKLLEQILNFGPFWSRDRDVTALKTTKMYIS